MISYVKRNTPTVIVELEQELNPELYNNLGLTYEDYLDDKWIQLSEQQLSFYKENPNASIKEILNMQLTEEDKKQNLIRKIYQYDSSDNVNAFIINGNKAWFTVQERLNYKQSIESAKLLGIQSLDFYIKDQVFTVSPEAAEYMLAQIQLYADTCYIVTKQHILNVNNLDSITDYDYKSGYPDMLQFELPINF